MKNETLIACATGLNETTNLTTLLNLPEIFKLCFLYESLKNRSSELTLEIEINACITTTFCFFAIMCTLYCLIKVRKVGNKTFFIIFYSLIILGLLSIIGCAWL